MDYPRLCKNCGQPFTGKNKFQIFCNHTCGVEYYGKLKKVSHRKRMSEIDKQIREEWDMYETNPTHCYKCGAEIDYWTFEYASRYGRVCKRCASGHNNIKLT